MKEDTSLILAGPQSAWRGSRVSEIYTVLAWTHAFPDVYVGADQIHRWFMVTWMPRWPHFPRAYVQQAQDASVAVCLSWDILRNVLPYPRPPENGRARTFQLGVPVSLDAVHACPEAVLAEKLHFFLFQVSDCCCFVINCECVQWRVTSSRRYVS